MKDKKTVVLFIIIMIVFLANLPCFAETVQVKYQVNSNFPPFAYVEGKYSWGFDLDFTNLIFSTKEYRIISSSDIAPNVYNRIKKGEIDLCGLIGVTEERKKQMLFTQPVVQTSLAFYTKKGQKKISLQNLSQYRIGVVNNYYAEDVLRNKLNIKNYYAFSNTINGLKALKQGKIDAFLEYQEVGDYFLFSQKLNAFITPQLTDLFPVQLAYGVSKGNENLLQYMNKRIDYLKKKGGYEELYQKYFSTHSLDYHEKQREKIVYWLLFFILGISLLFIGIQTHIQYLKAKMNKMKKQLKEEKDFSQIILDNANAFILVWDLKGNLLKFNQYAQERTGFTEAEVLGKKWMETFVPHEVQEETLNMFAVFVQGAVPLKRERKLKCKNGKIIEILSSNNLIFDNEMLPTLAFSICVDITGIKESERKLLASYVELEALHEELIATEEQLRYNFEQLQEKERQLKATEERYRIAVEGSRDVIWDWNLKNNEFFISNRIYELVGYKQEKFTSSIDSWHSLVHPDDLKLLLRRLKQHLATKSSHFQAEYRVKTLAGDYKWVMDRGKAIWNEENEPIRIAGSISDISQQKADSEKIYHLAYYDQLTGLSNRSSLKKDVLYALKQAEKQEKILGILFIDLDNFKKVNDTLGHSTGDNLLRQVADNIRNCLDDCSSAARLGGDEFVVLVKESSSIMYVVKIAKRILAALNQEYFLGGQYFHVSASIGIAIYPNHGQDSDTLLRNADTALYLAKEKGKNVFQLYKEEMNEQMMAKISLENDLRKALQKKEIEVYYQPQVDLLTGKLLGMEALVRWLHPQKGFISPAEFIPLAEQTGIIHSIGRFVLWTACAQNKKWQETGYKPLKVAVNVSLKEFQEKHFLDRVVKTLWKTGLEPAWLELEITESIAIQDFAATIKIIEQLRGIGISVALDDFGTGYSSLNYLKKLPINMLKIEQTFVKTMTASSVEAKIAKAIIDLAHSLELDILAEGVENEEQLNILKEYGCPKGQGYFFSKPLSSTHFEQLLKNY